MLNNCWININRACNLRCSWCYAKSSNYLEIDEMEIYLAKKIIDLITDIEIPSITILGGEPTCSNNLESILSYAKTKKRYVGLVTNGIKLSNIEYANKLLNYGLDSINISVKGYSKENFYTTTKTDKYYEVMRAIDNLVSLNAKFSVSMVLNRYNCDDFVIGIKDIIEHGGRNIRLSFCYSFDPLYDNSSCIDIKNDIIYVIEGLRKNYEQLNKITNGNFILHQSLPACVWPSDFLYVLKSNNQLKSSCQLLTRSGLIFDPKGRILPCNALIDSYLGQYGVDFENKNDFFDFWNSERIRNIYSKLAAVPDEKCLNCKSWVECGGGCVSNWLNYSYKDLMPFLSFK